LATLTIETDLDELFDLALATGRENLAAMSLLDTIHTEYFGTPVPHPISIGVRKRPGIWVTGHDLADLDWLLEQTRNTGIDVYTHSEMIAAHYYPKLFAHEHLVGNYGNAWWRQDHEFATFNGPIIVTSNCIIPVADAYRERIFTTGVAGYPGDDDGQLASRCVNPFNILIAVRGRVSIQKLDSHSIRKEWDWRACDSSAQ